MLNSSTTCSASPDDQPNFPDPDLEQHLTRSLTKENQPKKHSFFDVGGIATPKRKEALRPSTTGNVALEGFANQVGGVAKTPPRFVVNFCKNCVKLGHWLIDGWFGLQPDEAEVSLSIWSKEIFNGGLVNHIDVWICY